MDNEKAKSQKKKNNQWSETKKKQKNHKFWMMAVRQQVYRINRAIKQLQQRKIKFQK